MGIYLQIQNLKNETLEQLADEVCDTIIPKVKTDEEIDFWQVIGSMLMSETLRRKMKVQNKDFAGKFASKEL